MISQKGHERPQPSGTYNAARTALGLLSLMGGQEAARERVWSDRRRMLDSPEFRYLFYNLGDQVQHAMLAAGIGRTAIVAAHARAMALIYSHVAEALPVNGMTDARLTELGFQVEPHESQTHEFRLVEMPEGWSMVLGDEQLEHDTYTARVFDNNGNARLDLAFTAEPDGGACGTVSERLLPELAAPAGLAAHA